MEYLQNVEVLIYDRDTISTDTVRLPETQTVVADRVLTDEGLWFSQGAFGVANAQIPMVNIWDGR